MMILNKNMKTWLAALRSGKYEQGHNMLRSIDDKFCCMGLACHLYVEDGGDLPVEKRTLTMATSRYLYGGEGNYMPAVVADWLGVPWGFQNQVDASTCVDIAVKHGLEMFTLSSLNDDTMLPFPQIAVAIERTFGESYA